MRIDTLPRSPGDTSTGRARSVLLRVAGLAMFGLGLLYWTRLVGVFDGALWRFDLMPVPWRMAAPALAVLYPIAGVGLWMLVSWGVVLWIVVAAIEAVMVLGLPQTFGGDPLILSGHLGGLVALAALTAFGRWRSRPERSRARHARSQGEDDLKSKDTSD